MAVDDRWHRAPRPGDQPCREHSRGRTKLYPSAAHMQGARWQVRYRDAAGRQRSQNFTLKDGKNPQLHADAFDAKTRHELDTGDYTDPGTGDITFRAYAEDWRKSRVHDTVTAANVERRLRLHAYPVIGQRKMRELARRPSLIAAWIAGLKLAPSSARPLVGDVSAVFRAAMDDGITGRDPTRASSVRWPGRGTRKARPWTPQQVEGMRAALPGRYRLVPQLGAGTAMRQGEMFGLSVDDITFLGRDPRISVVRQVKLVGGVPHFAPVKNRKPHTVPLAPSLAPRLARHLQLYPAAAVTLPWHDLSDRDGHGKPVTVRLVLTDDSGRAHHRARFNEVWHRAQEAAGITPERERGAKRAPAREDGCHALRHTAASSWLRQGIDVVRVAAWMGDTPQVVLQTYAHLMPDDSDDDGRAAIDAFFAQCAPDVPAGEAVAELCQLIVPRVHLHWK